MAVAQSLRQQGLLVIDVKEQSVAQKDILAPFKGVRLKDLVVFSRQLATMINAVSRSCVPSTSSRADREPEARRGGRVVRKDVEAGVALSEA
jgi:type IV pilus assembly protein PilC